MGKINYQGDKTVSRTRMLVEGALMIAVGTVLSLLKLVDLPYGGSITLASMFPIILVAYRHGTPFGLLCGLVYAILQQLLGLKTLSWVTTAASVIAVIMLDYIVAFAVTGLGGVFRDKFKNQSGELVAGSLLVCVLRYICHVISGCTVWAGLSIPTAGALVYSFAYNATYMIPETIIVAIVAYYLGRSFDFRTATPRLVAEKVTVKKYVVFSILAGLVLAAAGIFDVAHIFSKLQNGESGDFDITGLSNVNWVLVAIITAVAIVIAVVLLVVKAQLVKKNQAEVQAKAE